MSIYRSPETDGASATGPNARAQRTRGLWLWFWGLLAAGLVVLGVTLARGAAAVLVSGFLPHPHP